MNSFDAGKIFILLRQTQSVIIMEGETIHNEPKILCVKSIAKASWLQLLRQHSQVDNARHKWHQTQIVHRLILCGVVWCVTIATACDHVGGDYDGRTLHCMTTDDKSNRERSRTRRFHFKMGPHFIPNRPRHIRWPKIFKKRKRRGPFISCHGPQESPSQQDSTFNP